MLRDDRAIVPGSYDPVTRGHLDVIARAGRLFRRLYVGVLENPEKEALFGGDERMSLLREELSHLKNVEVVSFRGLTVALAAEVEARWIVRGIRSPADMDYELPMALSNRRCGTDEIDTVFLPTSNELSFISSRLVRQIAAHGGVLSPFVTERVERALRSKFPAGG